MFISGADVTEGDEFKILYSSLKNNLMKIHSCSEDDLSVLDSALNRKFLAELVG